jgi:hypothetical protein
LVSQGFDAFARVLAQTLDAPVIARDAHDRAVQQAPLLQAVERAERHHLRQVTGDAEDHQRVCVLTLDGFDHSTWI